MDHVNLKILDDAEFFYLGNSDAESIFWISSLYIIGSEIVDIVKIKDLDEMSPRKVTVKHAETYEDPYNDPLTKVFCGYWILCMIADHRSISLVG